MTAYQIADEPTPSRLARFAVNPVFPLLAVMLGGVWIAWPWFAFNSIAVGSPTRRAELAWLGGGLVALVALVLALLGAAEARVIPLEALAYAFIGVIVVKLAVVYAVYVLQARTIEIYEYYGGVLNNGVWVLAAAFFLGGRLLDGLPLAARAVLQ